MSNNSISITEFNNNFNVIINDIKINNTYLNVEWLVQQKKNNNIGNINIFISNLNIINCMNKNVSELIDLSWSNIMTNINIWSANNYDPPNYKLYIGQQYIPSNI